jgi:hypothetical protein
MPPTVSVQEATRITGQHRTTIQRHIKRGKLSAHRDEAGNVLVDATELARVYGPFPPAPPLAQPAPPLAQPSAQPEPAHPQQPAPLAPALAQPALPPAQLAPQNALLLIETLHSELDAAQEREAWLLAQLKAARAQKQRLQTKLKEFTAKRKEFAQIYRSNKTCLLVATMALWVAAMGILYLMWLNPKRFPFLHSFPSFFGLSA